MVKTRLRIRFSKGGDLRWIGHRDLARVWERMLRRAELQLAFSEGFHPKPRISFPSALALGVEALEEVVELEVVGQFQLSDIESRVRAEMPSGMQMLSIESLDGGLGKAKVLGASYRVQVPAEKLPQLASRIENCLAEGRIEVQREKRIVSCSLSDPQFELRMEGEYLIFSLPHVAEGSLRPSEVLEHLGLSDLLQSGAVLQRTQVHLEAPASSLPPSRHTELEESEL